MPPKVAFDNRLSDTKVRKLTDFWGKKDSSSSTVEGGGSQPSQRTFPSSPARSIMGSKSAMSSPAKANASPRKYIVIDDDDDDDDEIEYVKTSLSKKRPRETMQDVSEPSKLPPINPFNATTNGALSSESNDLTSSPPKKRRAPFTSLSPIVASGSDGVRRMSSPFESTLHRRSQSLPPSSAQVSSVGGGDDLVHKPVDHKSKDIAPSIDTTLSENASSELSPVSMDVEMAKDDQSTDRATARIEEIKRQAELKRKGEDDLSRVDVNTINWDESEDDEDDDPLGSILVKSFPASNSSKRSSLTSRAKSPTPRSASTDSDFGSSLTDLSDGSPKTSKKVKSKQKAKQSSSLHRKDLDGLQEKSKQSAYDSFNMPSSLAEILVNDPKHERKSENRERVELLKKVHEDLEEMNRKILYDEGDATNHNNFDPSITKQALGEDNAKKINDALAFDQETVVDVHSWRPFWDDTFEIQDPVAMEVDFKIPSTPAWNHVHPILLELNNIESNNDIGRLRFLLTSGILHSLPLEIKFSSLVPWLITSACSSRLPPLFTFAMVRALTAILNEASAKMEHLPRISFSMIVEPILSLGVAEDALSCLKLASSVPSISTSRDARNDIVARHLQIVQQIIRSNFMVDDLENVAVLLFLLFMDPHTTTSLRRDITSTFDDFVSTVSKNMESQRSELAICQKLSDVTSSFPLMEKVKLLDMIFGGAVASRRLRRWLAFELIKPKTIHSIDWNTYLQPPSLSPLVEMLDPKLNPATPFRIWKSTDYDALYQYTKLLGVVLTDVQIYKAAQTTSLEAIVERLTIVQGKIVDLKSATLARTRVKDSVQRLRHRIHYQVERKQKTTLDTMFRK
ncbi:hypothetical protein CPB86DRAFT_816136 [Serendipita vermifera]|nr:hypothetical protein CPB86DRAFT_816136 [Serendipita vermifera]